MLLKSGKYITLISSQILYTFVVHAEIATIFGPNVVALSACNTKVNKICKLCKTIFSEFYNISQPGGVGGGGGGSWGGGPGRAVPPPPTSGNNIEIVSPKPTTFVLNQIIFAVAPMFIYA
jgi:hypothetical protein